MMRIGRDQGELDAIEARLRLANNDRERIDPLLGISTALRSSDPLRALESAGEALDLALRLGAPLVIADAHRAVGLRHLECGRHAEALGHLRSALEIHRHQDNLPLQILILSDMGRALLLGDDVVGAFTIYMEQLQKSESLGDRLAIARSLRDLGEFHRRLGDLDRGMLYLRRGLALAGGLADQGLVGAIHYHIGLIHLQNGRPVAAVDELERSIAIIAGSDPLMEGRGRLRLGQGLSSLGMTEPALDQGTIGLERSLAAGDDATAVQLLILLGFLEELRGDARAAIAYSDRSIRISASFPDQSYVAAASLLRGDLHRERGELESAAEFYRRCVAAADVSGNSYWKGKGCAALATLHEQRGEFERAVGYYRLFIECRGERADYVRQANLDEMREFWRFGTGSSQREVHRRAAEELERELERRRGELQGAALEMVRAGEVLDAIYNDLQALSESLPAGARPAAAAIARRLAAARDGRSEWNTFEGRFDLVNPGFLREISSAHPELTPAELKVCSLLRVSLSSKEIASALGISPESADTYRSRIRKKLRLPSQKSLVSYLASI
ncbi:MAG: hypothetical protein JWQ98_1137 [Chlorobi bacterium]|nr:hypothetical protein [Chlorobiota bacterium]